MALVTGAGRGLGAEIARGLAGQGVAVALLARTSAEVEAVAAGIGDRALAVVGDVASEDDVARVLRVATERFGPVTVLVNNAAVLGPIAPITDTQTEAWFETQRINVLGAYLCLRAVIPGMRAAGQGEVLGVTSGAALHPLANNSAYDSSKAAFEQLHRVVAAEVADQGIRVALFDPGGVDTEMMARVQSSEFPGVERFRALRVGAGLRSASVVAGAAVRLILDGLEPARRYRVDELLSAAV